MEIIGIIILLILVLPILFSICDESRRLKKYKRQIRDGVKLTCISKEIGNEFDEGTRYYVTVVQTGKKQVKIEWSDGTQQVCYYWELYQNGWTGLEESSDDQSLFFQIPNVKPMTDITLSDIKEGLMFNTNHYTHVILKIYQDTDKNQEYYLTNQIGTNKFFLYEFNKDGVLKPKKYIPGFNIKTQGIK